jgi:hypothetical protein
VRQISPGTFGFQKSATLRSPAAVVKGMKALRFRSVFRAGICCQESLQKRVEDPLCSSQKEWSVMSSRLFLAAFQMSEPGL